MEAEDKTPTSQDGLEVDKAGSVHTLRDAESVPLTEDSLLLPGDKTPTSQDGLEVDKAGSVHTLGDAESVPLTEDSLLTGNELSSSAEEEADDNDSYAVNSRETEGEHESAAEGGDIGPKFKGYNRGRRPGKVAGRSALVAGGVVAALIAVLLFCSDKKGLPLFQQRQKPRPLKTREEALKEGPLLGAPEGVVPLLEKPEEGADEKETEEIASKEKTELPVAQAAPFPPDVPKDATAYEVFRLAFFGEAPDEGILKLPDGFLRNNPEATQGFEAFAGSCDDPHVAEREPQDEKQRKQRDWKLYCMYSACLSRAEVLSQQMLGSLSLKGNKSERQEAINKILLEIYALKEEAARDWRQYQEEYGLHPNDASGPLISQILRSQEVYYARLANRLRGVNPRATRAAQNFKGDPRLIYTELCNKLPPEDKWIAMLIP